MGISWYLLGLLTCFLTLGCEKVVVNSDSSRSATKNIEALFDSVDQCVHIREQPDSALSYLEKLQPLCQSTPDLMDRYNGHLLALAWSTGNYEDVLTVAGPRLLNASLKGEVIAGHDPRYFNMSAHALRKLGDTASATKMYLYLAELNLLAMRRGAQANLLTLYAKGNKYQRAIEIAEQIYPAERMNPLDISAHLNREYYWARSLAALGKTTEATKHFEEFLAYIKAPRANHNSTELRVRLSTVRSIMADLINVRVPNALRNALKQSLQQSIATDSLVLSQKFRTREIPTRNASLTIAPKYFLTPSKQPVFIRSTSLRDLTITATATDSRDIRWVSTLHGLYVCVGEHLVHVALPHTNGLRRPIRSIRISGDTIYVESFRGTIWPTPIAGLIAHHAPFQQRNEWLEIRPLNPKDHYPMVSAKLRLNDTAMLIGTPNGLTLSIQPADKKQPDRIKHLREPLTDTVVSLYRIGDTIVVFSYAQGTRAILITDALAGKPKYFSLDGFRTFYNMMMGPAVTDIMIKQLRGEYTGSQRPVVDETHPTTLLRLYFSSQNAVALGTRAIFIASKPPLYSQLRQWPDTLRNIIEGGFYSTLLNDSTLELTVKHRVITLHLNRLLNRQQPQFLAACLSENHSAPWIGWLENSSTPTLCTGALTLAVGSTSTLSAYHPLVSTNSSWGKHSVVQDQDGLYHIDIPNVRSCSLTFSSPGLIQSGTLLLKPHVHPLVYQDVLIALVMLVSGGLGYGTVFTWQRVANRQKETLEQHQDSIARDLHDTLGSDLARLSALINATDRQDSRSIVSAALAANRKFRSLLWIWRSDSISLSEFLGEVREYASACLADAGIELAGDPIIVGEDRYVDADIAKNVLIIINESITNIIRHASASHATLHLRRDDASITVELLDNGKGFDVDQLTRKSGINNITQRAAQNGFHAHVDSIPQHGTRVVVSFGVYSS